MASEIDISPYVDKFEEYYSVALQEKINKLLSEYPVQKSLYVDYEDLERFDRDIADRLIKEPDIMLNSAEQALIQTQEVAYKTAHPDLPFEPHVRFFNLPETGLLIQDISSKQIRELISVKGVVTKRAPVRHKVKIALYKCQMCDAEQKVPLTKNAAIPQVCPECKRRALKLEEEESYFVDVQHAEAQELLERLKGGSPAATIALWLEDDLVNKLTPGETVTITGVMRLRPPQKDKGKAEAANIYTRYIDVISAQKTQREFEEIETTKEDEQQIREMSTDPQLYEKVRDSIAQGIYGHNEVKEALSLQLFGGTSGKSMAGGGAIRDDMHILLIGDPGSAKTRFLQSIQALAPKGIYVSGKSVTGVGLTASAEKDEMGDGGWTLKAGALVIASGGIAGVDEFDKIDDTERAAMHEVMESQSYHPSTKLLLADGREVKIGQFVEKLLAENSGNAKEGRDCIILDSGLGGISILTTDFSKIYPVQISQVSKHKAPASFVRVTLQNGRELLVTPEHPFWTVKDGNISTMAASQLRTGEFTTVPSILPLGAAANGAGDPPGTDSPQLFKFLGYHISDGGYELNRGRKNGINFWNKDPDIIEDYIEAAGPLFHSNFSLSTDARTGAGAARLASMGAVRMLQSLSPALMEKGREKILPEQMMAASGSCAREFLRSIFEGDGSISKRGTLGLVCENMRLAEQVQVLLLRFGVEAHIIPDGNVFRLYSTGEGNLAAFSSKIGFVSERKEKTLQGCLLAKKGNSARRNWAYSEVVPGCGSELARLMACLKLTQTQAFGHLVCLEQPAFSRPLFRKALRTLRQRLERLKELHSRIGSMSVRELASERRALGISQHDIGGNALRSLVGYWERNSAMENRYKALFRTCCMRMLSAEAGLEKLERLLNSEVKFCRIKKIEIVRNQDVEWVYDVGAGPTQAFISECAILHNSVSVAKAGIVARFKAKTAILAAANPKFGRFDQNKLPGQQFDIPPTILSRFDLIFPILDVMDREKDSTLATYILNMHQSSAKTTSAHAPPAEQTGIIDPIFLRKYVAYARQNVRPILSDEAMEKIREFYVEMRSRGKADGAVPITPRAIEGLIRMSEASAKIRLSNAVEVADAERAIRLTTYVLDKVSRDRETGRIDADILATGRPKSAVDKINTVLDLARKIQAEAGEIEIRKLVEASIGHNMDEITAQRIVDDLIYKGELYKIRPGVVKMVEQSG